MSILIGNSNLYHPKKCSSNYLIHQSNIQDCLTEITSVFNSLNITVNKVDSLYYPGCNLLWVRDNFINLNGKIIIFKGTKNSTENQDRSQEYRVFTKIFSKYIVCPEKIEGGDIIESKEDILCGIGIRTSYNGSRFLSKFTNKKIINIRHSALHLDCCLAVLPNRIILYSQQYIQKLPKYIMDNYQIFSIEKLLGIGVSSNIDPNLSTNFVLVNNTVIISNNPKFSKIRQWLRSLGYSLQLIHVDRVKEMGGAIRCLTQWIEPLQGNDIY